MSATSEIFFKGREFSADKSILQVWMLLVIQEIDKTTDQSVWLQEMRHDWEGYTIGGVDLDYFYGLDDYITDQERLTLMLSLCEAALRRLDIYGPIMSKEALNNIVISLGSHDLFSDDIATVEFKKVGTYFIKLFKEELRPEENDALILEEG